MKTKWQFFLETDFLFDREYKFRGSIPKDAVTSTGKKTNEQIEFNMSIVPDKEQKHPTAEQTGIMYITIPFTYEEGREVVKGMAYLLSERISFDFGKMKIHTGLILCERIPETPEEAEQIGDAPFAAEMTLEEVVSPPTFDAKKLSDQSLINMDTRLVAQHNAAREHKNPIEKFLGFFKIIETLYGPHSDKIKFKDALVHNADLFNLFRKAFQFETAEDYKREYAMFIEKIVKGRHRCAHMRLKKDFGYWSSDPRVKTEIEPYIGALEALTYYAIRGA